MQISMSHISRSIVIKIALVRYVNRDSILRCRLANVIIPDSLILGVIFSFREIGIFELPKRLRISLGLRA